MISSFPWFLSFNRNVEAFVSWGFAHQTCPFPDHIVQAVHGQHQLRRSYLFRLWALWVQHGCLRAKDRHRQFRVFSQTENSIDCHHDDLLFRAGLGENELNGLAFRLPDDLALVLTKDKKLMSLADFMHRIATVDGVAAVELSDHLLTPKQRPATGPVTPGPVHLFFSKIERPGPR